MAPQAGEGHLNKIKDLLLGQDVAGQVELLLNLLSDAAAGKELSNVLSEVIQVIIAGGVGHHAVKKLAYDLCKAVPLLPSDYSLLVDGIKNDISCGIPESQVLALRFLPHLPHDYLCALLDKGEIANFVAPHTRNVVPSVRCAATSALGAVLLVPEVQAVMAASADTAASCSDWWDAVVDSVGDSLPDVVVAGLAATNALYDAAAASSSGSSGGSTACGAAAQRATLRLAAGIGPLMDTWRMLPSHAQVPVIQLLGHVWMSLVEGDTSTVAAVATPATPFGAPPAAAAARDGSSAAAAAALPGMLAYLSGSLSSLNPAVKLEAARAILRASRLARKGAAAAPAAAASSSSQPLGRLRLVGEVPPSTAAAAIEALLELKGRLLVEAALEEVVSLVAAHLDVLQVPTRLVVLSRLWPLISMLQSPTDRLTAFAHAWQAALALALDSAAAAAQGTDPPAGTAATLSGILADPFLEDIISDKSSSSSSFAPGSSSNGAAAGPDAGPTGGSVAGLGPAAAGATGASVMSSGAGGREDSFSEGGSSFPGGSVVTQSRSKRMIASAKGLVTSGAALAGNMGSSLAAAATGALTSLPRLLWDTPPPAKAQLPATLKQELVCTLLSVLGQHPAAAAALQLPPGKPVPPPPPSAAAAAAAAASRGQSGRLSRLQSGAPQQQQQLQGAGMSAAGAANGVTAPGQLQPPPTDAAGPGAAAAAATAAADGSSAATEPTAAAAAAVQSPQQQQQPLRPQFGLDDVTTSPIVASLQSQVVMWLGAAVSALAATRACLQWEPLVVPPMPGQPPSPPLPPMASVHLTTVPVDSWLQLLQAACHAVRAVVRLHGYDSLKAIYRCNGGRMLAALSPWDVAGALARTCEAAAAALQQLLTRELAEWRGLALAVRPRVLWVAAHYLELPSLLDDTWGVLLGCVDESVCRGAKQEADGRTRQLAASARDGLLLKRFAAPQLLMGRDKAGAHTSFDAAAASALVEMPEYRSDALQVGLTVLQYLVWVVQANITAAQAGTGSHPGPAEEALARKLLDLVHAAEANDAAGVDVRDWVKRMAHVLGAILDPLGAGTGTAAGAAAAAAGGPAFAMLPPAGATGAAAKGAQLPGGYNAVAGFSALGFGGGTSSDDSDDESEVRRMTREQRLQRKLGLDGGKRGSGKGSKAAAAAAAGGSSSDDDDAALSSSSSSDESAGSDGDSSSSGDESSPDPLGGSSDEEGADGAPVAANPFSAGAAAAAAAAATAAASKPASGQHKRKQRDPSKAAARAAAKAAKAAKKAAKAAKKAALTRARAESVAVGAPDSASGVWGYPFGGPRSQTLFISRRSRRHRLFKWHLALAMANLHDSDLTGGVGGGNGAAAAAAAAVRSGGYGGGFAGGLFGTAAGAGGSNGGSSTMATAGLTDATGPVFSAESGFRLDQPGFWGSLHGVESGWVDLSGPADPLLLSGRYSTSGGAGSAGGDISVTLRAFNRLSVDLEGVEVVLRLVGPVKAERREATWNLPPLMPTEAAQHTFTLTPTGYGRLEVHTRLVLPLPQLASEMAVNGPPSLSCQPLVVDMARLLRPPACPPPNAQEVLALWSSLPVQVELSATALWPGVDGLLLLLSALARAPMYCAWCHMTPVVCGAQAAFVANPTTHTGDSIVILMLAQLMPDEAAAAEAAAAAAAAADAAEMAKAAAAAAAAGDDANNAESDDPWADNTSWRDKKQKQQPDFAAAADPAAAAGASAQASVPMRCVVQLVVRSSSHEVMLALQQQPEAWVQDISQGTLCCGVSGRLTPLSQQGKPLLHPLVARLEQQLAPADLLGPPPPPVPPLELPLVPKFRRKLAAKADEEDSDGEDTELPLTAEEREQQQRALDKHKEECDKAQEKHAAAKASRAAAVLRASALAEWRRTACPPLFVG